MVCLVAGVVAIIDNGVESFGSQVLHDALNTASHPTATSQILTLWPTDLADTMAFLGVTIFCFDICSLAFPIQESMREPQQFSKAALWSLLCVWTMYVALGNTGALLYAHDEKGISENILSNLPMKSVLALVVRWAMACVSYNPLCYALFAMVHFHAYAAVKSR
jgi:amino acid permease